MGDLIIDDLLVRVDRSAPGCLRLDWLGCSDSAAPEPIIRPFFERVLAEAVESGRFVDMHFEAVDCFNSATIATLIHLVFSAGKAKVPLHIHYDAKRRWQVLAFEALERVVHCVGSEQGLSWGPFSGPFVSHEGLS